MRIVGGVLGGRTLVAPKGRQTRPTPDNVRESAFNILGDVIDLAVLDVFAGTGAMGIEALSRGAARAVFVDVGRDAFQALGRNIERLDLRDVSEVVHDDAIRALKRFAQRSERFDLIFLDPPYDQAGVLFERVRPLLDEVATPTARVVVEHSRRQMVGWSDEVLRERRYGNTTLTIYSLGET